MSESSSKSKGSEDKENEGPRFGKNNNKYNKQNKKYDESGGFKGGYESMNGHVFQMREESRVTLQFDKTCKELIRFIVKKFKNPDDLVSLVMNMKETKIRCPDTPEKDKRTGKLSRSNKLIHRQRVNQYLVREQSYEENKKKLFMVVWDQCSKSLQNRLESIQGFDKIKRKRDVLKMLKKIKSHMYDFDETEFLGTSLNTAVMSILNCKQGNSESNANYLARFRNNLDVLEYYGGTFGVHDSLVKKEMELNHIAYDPRTFHR